MTEGTNHELQKIKKQLKLWETDFVKHNGRKPDKEGISNAPPDIQEAYKQYGVLKKQLQQERCPDSSKLQDNLNAGAWGAELNKSQIKVSNQDQSEDGEKITKKASSREPSLMSKLGQKLLEKSALSSSKKKPSWGLSRSDTFQGNHVQTDSPSAFKFNHSFSKSDSTPDRLFSGNGFTPHKNKCDLVEKENSLASLSEFNFNDSVSESLSSDVSSKPRSSFLSVLANVSVGSKSSVKNDDKLSQESSLPVPFTPKRRDLSSKYKFLDKFQPADDEIDCLDDIDQSNLSKPFEDETPKNNTKPKISPKPVVKDTVQPSLPSSVQSQSESLNKLPSNEEDDPYSFLDEELLESGVQYPTNKLEPTKTVETASRGRKRVASGDIVEDEGDIRANKRSRVSSQETTGRGRKRGVVKKVDEAEDEWEKDGMSEVGWQPDKPAVELEISTENAEGEEAENENEDQPKKKSKSKSLGASKPISSDNFVRLNMKLKTYRRKGKGMTGGQYKRKMWKDKMKSRSESRGDACFKCGQAGHWANKCKNKGQSQAPKINSDHVADNVVKDEEFPSIREAIAMSRGMSQSAPKPKPPPRAKKAVDTTEDIDHLPAAATEAEEDEDLDVEFEIYRQEYEMPEAPPSVEPLYELEENGAVPEPTPEVLAALKKYGFSGFRPGQKEAVMRILCGLSTLVVLSTGSGKSLCYQLPAYLYGTKSQAITLVISPLVSLMEDQVTGLPPGIKGACLHTNMTKTQRQRVIDSIIEDKVHFLLVSPEAMTSSSRANSLLGGAKLPPIAFACIDEAHCVSEWSHHFRPSYLRICKVLREHYGVKCMLGLTATATLVTAASVSQHLGIEDYRSSTIRDIPVPTNLLLSVSRDEDKDQALLALLQGDRFSECRSIIIYCTRRQQTDRVATLIRTCLKDVLPPEEPDTEPSGKGKGKSAKKSKLKPCAAAECYHAGLSAAQRRRVQNAFMSGRLRIVVATVAFGMGVDKSDVRGIIHYTMPKSYESYVQEIGRAGRDGKPSHCHVFLDHGGGDLNELKRHIYGNTIDRFVIKKLVKKVFQPCRCADKQRASQVSSEENSQSPRTCPGHERTIPIDKTVQALDIKEEGIATLLCYLELHAKRWVLNLQSVYSSCSIQCYGGPQQLQAISKKCPPVAVAIARQRKFGVSFTKSNSVEFDVVDVSDSMGWESGPVKRELKALQWDMTGIGGTIPRKSGVLVSFADLAFHLRSPGNLTDDETEEIVSFLTDRVQTQERTELAQLQRLDDTLRGVSHKDVWMCADRLDTNRSDKLKKSLRDYFDEQPKIENGKVTMLSFAREYGSLDQSSVLEVAHCENEDQVRSDIRQFVHLYGEEHNLSGRVIARILQGIPSACFPAEIWGRVRRFWRSHLDVDFNLLRRIATQVLIGMR